MRRDYSTRQNANATVDRLAHLGHNRRQVRVEYIRG